MGASAIALRWYGISGESGGLPEHFRRTMLPAAMCTIIVLHRVHPRLPLVVAANRDEMYARQSVPPDVLDPAEGIVGGRDGLRGGTWMGVTPSGLFLGVTNQRTHDHPPEAPRSRGQLALEALRAGSREGIRHHLGAVDPSQYNSFNFVWGDTGGVEVAYGRRDADRVELLALPEGLHVLTNDRLGSPEFPKADRARELVEPHATRPWGDLERTLRETLADHDEPDEGDLPPPPPGSRFPAWLVRKLQAICIHAPGYGTRSSTILAVEDGGVARYLFADGPPCKTPFEDFTHLLRR